MEKGYRQTMRWVHTWSGLILGWLLFAIFVTGTSSYYKNEITLWMQPELHKSIESKKTLDIAINKVIQASKKSDNVALTLPNSRSNTIQMMAQSSNSNAKAHSHGGAAHVHGPNGEEIPVNQGKKTNNKEVKTKKDTSKNKNMQRRGRPQADKYDASTGEQIKPRSTAGGDFLYRFHFELYNMPRNVSRIIVGIATMFMFVTIISGLIMHRRIFKDIFTFRAKEGTRGWMDAHILPAVAALPFLILITYSGLLLLTNSLMPWAMKAHFGNNPMAFFKEIKKANAQEKVSDKNKVAIISKEENQEVKDTKNLQRLINARALKDINRSNNKTAQRLIISKQNRQIISFKKKALEKQENNLDLSKDELLKVLSQANKLWPNNIGSFTLQRDKTKKTLQVKIFPKKQTSIFSFKRDKEFALYEANTGKLISRTTTPLTNSIIRNTSTAFSSLHMALFADSTLRFIFFICGLLGVVISGTGLVLWIVKRKKQNELKKSFGFYLVEKLNLGTIMGIFIALGVYFLANRFIPFDEPTRRTLEINAFFIAWAASYIYSFLRNTNKAWKEQLIFAISLYALLPIVNAFTSFESIFAIFNRDAILIYFDLFFIFMALVFSLVTFIIIKKEKRGEIK